MHGRMAPASRSTRHTASRMHTSCKERTHTLFTPSGGRQLLTYEACLSSLMAAIPPNPSNPNPALVITLGAAVSPLPVAAVLL